MKGLLQQQKVKGLEALNVNHVQIAQEVMTMIIVEGQHLKIEKNKGNGGSAMGLYGAFKPHQGKSSPSAPNWRMQNTQNNNNKGSPSDKGCFYCKKKGHMA